MRGANSIKTRMIPTTAAKITRMIGICASGFIAPSHWNSAVSEKPGMTILAGSSTGVLSRSSTNRASMIASPTVATIAVVRPE